ncbi:hypothetical protein GUJ93_ZPchr0114g29020 [Zizania palustris]|uniref:Secreted protein n=1 Tax=Zizania palustris TaxID=103762 RepID=A0A8J5QUP9_ZIZPA|nr:hypothetical protein GUJ93_ZPchr0114g29020 [Zizania palustris]
MGAQHEAAAWATLLMFGWRLACSSSLAPTARRVLAVQRQHSVWRRFGRRNRVEVWLVLLFGGKACEKHKA